MTVNPFGERPADLLILEQTILFVCRVDGNPLKGPNLEFYPRTGLYAPFFLNHPYRGKRRTQEFQCIFPFMKRKYDLDRRANQNAFDEDRQCQLSIPGRPALPADALCSTNSS